MPKNIGKGHKIVKVVMYCRVGRVENPKEILVNQKARIEKFCKEQGYSVVGIVTAMDKGARMLAFNKLKQLIEVQDIDGVVTEKFSDITRSASTLMKLRDFAKEHNAVVMDIHNTKL